MLKTGIDTNANNKLSVVDITQHKELDPRLWGQQQGTGIPHLRPQVRTALLKIAGDFKQYVDVEFDTVDVVLTGSEAGYYYTQHSDLDLHLVVDYKNVGPCTRELDELFDTKRHLYKRDHTIEIYGIPVELYVEDTAAPAKGPRYSITNSRWLVKPEKHSQSSRPTNSIDHSGISKMTELWSLLIERSIASKSGKIAAKTLELLRKYRQMGLESAGEFGTPNLVYKTLRNKKTVEKLADFVDREHDRSLSLREKQQQQRSG